MSEQLNSQKAIVQNLMELISHIVFFIVCHWIYSGFHLSRVDDHCVVFTLNMNHLLKIIGRGKRPFKNYNIIHDISITLV